MNVGEDVLDATGACDESFALDFEVHLVAASVAPEPCARAPCFGLIAADMYKPRIRLQMQVFYLNKSSTTLFAGCIYKIPVDTSKFILILR
eukprot:6201750-Pleurochrysis_carterae.AAC.1